MKSWSRPAPGCTSGFPDAQYTQHGARIAADRAELASANVIVHVRACAADPLEPLAVPREMQANQILVALCDPLWDPQADCACWPSGG